jgi:ATP-dependent DNA helicase DinG
MDKLPFDSPGDPVVAARIKRLEASGHEPFESYQLPGAALTLKQGFGRLIRTRRDVGIVAILDRRLVTRNYGRRLIAALPPASRCASFDELEAFWASVAGGD